MTLVLDPIRRVLGPITTPIVRGFRWLLDRIRQTEIDLRLFGMVIALAIILGLIELADAKNFLIPVNLINLAVQAAPVAIIACGMVLVIVTRQIDLSVGSIVGVVSMTIAILFYRLFPPTIGVDSSFGWIIALAAGVGVGGLIGAFHGFLIAYVGIPSFIVTLGGLLAWRGVVFIISGGSTIAPDDKFFVLLFAGGPLGSIGGVASWVVAAAAVVAVVFGLINSRRQRQRFGFPLRPRWAEGAIVVAASIAAIGFVAFVANAYKWPKGLVDNKLAQDPTFVVPPGGIESGIPNPMLIMFGVMIVVTFIATRLRFGRAIYALGGNPDAAELAGINTRWTVMKTFILLGLLCGVAGAIASARLNGASLDIGQGYELLVIAAAVIGGTSFSGGIGTVPGAILGALVMQALAYGLSYLGVSTPGQNIASGIVLVVAVGFDTWNSEASPMTVSQQTPDLSRPAGAAPDASRAPLVEMRRINVSFGGVRAVADVTIDVRPGEVIGLVGGNGAGKSTLMRALSGAHRADSGEILMDGKPVTIANPRDAKNLAIETIYQTLALADNLNAPGNLFLGRELLTRTRTLDDSAMEDATRKVMGRLNPNFKRFASPVVNLSGGQRQAVAIARAVHFNARVLIMDEPTAALGPAETAQVRDLIRQLKGEGIGIFLVSHDIHDVFDLADRISVMYHGGLVGTVNKLEVTTDQVLGMIILGKPLTKLTSEDVASLSR